MIMLMILFHMGKLFCLFLKHFNVNITYRSAEITNLQLGIISQSEHVHMYHHVRGLETEHCQHPGNSSRALQSLTSPTTAVTLLRHVDEFACFKTANEVIQSMFFYVWVLCLMLCL